MGGDVAVQSVSEYTCTGGPVVAGEDEVTLL